MTSPSRCSRRSPSPEDHTPPARPELIKTAPPIQGDPEAFRTRLTGFGIQTNPAPGILWNFEKFVIGRDGQVAARFAPSTTPDDPELLKAIDMELAR